MATLSSPADKVARDISSSTEVDNSSKSSSSSGGISVAAGTLSRFGSYVSLEDAAATTLEEDTTCPASTASAAARASSARGATSIMRSAIFARVLRYAGESTPSIQASVNKTD